jgi:polygalacturonase
VGDGTTDDTAAIQSALDAADDGDVVFVPPGTYRVTSALTQSDTELAVVGGGQGVSVLRFVNDTNGLEIDYTTNAGTTPKSLTVRELTLEKALANSGTAIEATWPDYSSSIWHHAVFENVEMRGTDVASTNNCWLNGIRVDEGWHSLMNGIMFTATGARNGSAILLENQSIASCLFDVRAYNCDTGVVIDTPCEGVRITNSDLVAVNDGVRVRNGTGRPPQLNVQNTHVAAHSQGVQVQHRAQSCIAGNLIYKRDDDTDFTGVTVQDSQDVRVVNNCFIDLSGDAGATNGVVTMEGSERAIVTGNQFVGFDTGIWLQSGTDHHIAKNNTGKGIGGSVVLDNGANDIVRANIDY